MTSLPFGRNIAVDGFRGLLQRWIIAQLSWQDVSFFWVLNALAGVVVGSYSIVVECLPSSLLYFLGNTLFQFLCITRLLFIFSCRG